MSLNAPRLSGSGHCFNSGFRRRLACKIPGRDSNKGAGLVELRILGHRLAVRDDSGVPIEISRGQVRELLCALAIDSGSVVSAAALIERLWEDSGGDPAKSLRQAVYNARQLLPADRLLTEPGGYRLQVGDSDYFDLAEFRRLADEARAAVDAVPEAAVGVYQRAMRLWGTPPLGDLPDTIGMEPVRHSLLGALLDVREELAEALLALHRYREVVDSATRWLAEDPFNEHLRGLLMLALAGAGRKGEALRAYREAVALLAPEARPGGWLEGVARQISDNEQFQGWSPRPVWLASAAHQQAGTGIDTTIPSSARVYDCLLGGKDNFAADREAAATLVKNYPQAPRLARLNRGFVIRAVRYLAQAGIRQYIDIGTGLPTMENVHEVARRAIPDARVLYVDYDPIVCVHGRALLTTDDGVALIQADVRDPRGILEHPTTQRVIDFSQPVAILLATVMHFVPDEDDPQAIVTAYTAALPPGGYLVVSHSTFPATLDQHVARTNTTAKVWGRSGMHPRDYATVAGFFDGLALVEPGLVDAPDWRPSLSADKVEAGMGTWWVGIGRKEGSALT
jgi:DNA-binding SARP family transcriptional activator